MFSRVLCAAVLVTSLFATQGYAAPLTDSTQLAARGQGKAGPYSACLSRCVEEFAAGPNRVNCMKKCDALYPNHRRSFEEEKVQLVSRGQGKAGPYSACLSRCVEEFAAGPNRVNCMKKCDALYPNHRRSFEDEKVQLVSRGQGKAGPYSACLSRCVEEFAAGPNRVNCMKKCDALYPNHRRSFEEEEIQLVSRGQGKAGPYSACLSRCVEEFAAGPNRVNCMKKCDALYPNHRRSFEEEEAQLVSRGQGKAGPYSACLSRCVEEFAAGPNRVNCMKKCDALYPNHRRSFEEEEIQLVSRGQGKAGPYSACLSRCVEEFAAGPNRVNCMKKCDALYPNHRRSFEDVEERDFEDIEEREFEEVEEREFEEVEEVFSRGQGKAGPYSACLSRCVEEFAAGPNRVNCMKKCDALYPNH